MNERRDRLVSLADQWQKRHGSERNQTAHRYIR